VRRALLLSLLAGCSTAQQIDVVLRVPAGESPLRFADAAVLSIADATGRVLDLHQVTSDAQFINLNPVPVGKGYMVGLDATFGPDVVARGRSCPFDVSPTGSSSVPMYFARVGRAVAATGVEVAAQDAVVFPGSAGQVIVAGGMALGGVPRADSDRYDHVTGQLSAGPSLSFPRVGAQAAVLLDGTVLILGGATNGGAAGIEQYSMGAARPLATAFPADLVDEAIAVLGDGRVLVTGGTKGSGAPGTWALLLAARGNDVTDGAPMAHGRARHTLTVGGADRFSPAFVVGGQDGGGPLGSIEIFDSTANSFSPVASTLADPRFDHTATLLANGRLLIVGGNGAQGVLASSEIFDPITRTVRPTGKLHNARARHTATLLPSGRVLIAGGVDASGAPTDSVELFDPNRGPAGDFVPAASLSTARAGHSAIVLCDGTLLLAGGGPGADVYTPTP